MSLELQADKILNTAERIRVNTGHYSGVQEVMPPEAVAEQITMAAGELLVNKEVTLQRP